MSGALLTRSEFPKRWIPLGNSGPVETFVSNANVLAARPVLAKSAYAILSWLPLEAGSEPVSGALLTRSEFPKRWIPLGNSGPVETFQCSVCDISLCRRNKFRHSSSPVIACLRAEYMCIFEMKLKLSGYGYM